jgi:hypothetical protein
VIGNVFIAFCLLAATVIVHSAGLVLALGVVLRSRALRPTEFVRIAWLVIRVACWLVLVHRRVGLLLLALGLLPRL